MKASRRGIPLVASSCAALISGCMVGPDYHLPESAVINSSAARQDFVSSADLSLIHI